MFTNLTNSFSLALHVNIFFIAFYNKIDFIIIKIKNHNPSANYPSPIVTPPISDFLSFCHPPHIFLISKLLHASTSISPSDPVPLSIFKLYIEYICPTICNIILYSLNSGTVPTIFKLVIITPILKKTFTRSRITSQLSPNISATFGKYNV